MINIKLLFYINIPNLLTMRKILYFTNKCFICLQVVAIIWYYNVLNKWQKVAKTKIKKHSYLIRDNDTSSDLELRVTLGHCVGLLFPKTLDVDHSWNPVDVELTSYVFSAYLTDGGKNVVFIGATILRPQKSYCQFWIKNGTNIRLLVKYSKPVKIRRIPEGHGRIFTAALFECKGIPFTPTHVSLVTKLCDTPLNLMQVRNASIPTQYKRLFTVCLPPLRMNDSRTNELVEWIEFNKILGAQKILAYNYSITSNIHEILEHYSNQGIVEIVNWQLPNQKKTNSSFKNTPNFDTFYFAQLAAVEDCLFRSKHESKFIVHVDVDEFVIPHQTNASTWSDMLIPLDHSTSSYNIRHAWFRKEWDSESANFQSLELDQQIGLITLQKNLRMAYIPTHWVRSKYIARTATVDILMIHRIARGPPFVVVPPEVGLLHHYRIGEGEPDIINMERKKKGKVKDDTAIQKYAQTLMKKVQKACESIHCQLNKVKMT